MKETNILLADLKNAISAELVRVITDMLMPVNDVAKQVLAYKAEILKALNIKAVEFEGFVDLVESAEKMDKQAREKAGRMLDAINRDRDRRKP